MTTIPARNKSFRYLVKITVVAALYFGAAQLGILLTLLHGADSLFWAPAGFALAALLLLGDNVWPGIALGIIVINALQGQSPSIAYLVTSASAGTLEALLACFLLRRFVDFHVALNRTSDALGLIALGALLSTTVSATIGVFGLCLSGQAPWPQYGSLWLVWWLGDAVGILGWTPVLLLWGAWVVSLIGGKKPDPVHVDLEHIAWLTLLIATGVVIFYGHLVQSAFALAFLPFPLLMWAALRLGQRAAVTGSLIIAILAVLRILTEPGPLAPQSMSETLIVLWLFIGITAGTTLLLAATVAERREGEARIAHLNAELEARAAELEAANNELDAYNASISHDLRGPLSNIMGFAAILLERDAAQLPPSVLELLQHIDASAHRMENLVSALLDFSRTSHQTLNKELLQPVQVVNDALAELGNPQKTRSAPALTLIVGELPPCEADPALLKQIYTNLLSNALKFTGNIEVALIEVGYKTLNSESGNGGLAKGAYFVRDNGVGFDMARAEHLFTPFQRLHSGSQYSGNGIGLSLVKRIVERHGGRIWAEAAPDSGATFYFTLG
ncbi:MAG TPA: MASE1 domain-containing protein [Aggregatilineales bacterium]|nr:MASE1 domain-containing protein [Aggregatilineales bacterium]